MTRESKTRFRLILPAFPHFNVYGNIAGQTTALGPICVATAASRVEGWDVEVIDENNCRGPHCPRDRDGLPDHRRLQERDPADVVGFYGSLSSTAPRLYALANLYREMGARTVAGGKHVENLPEEALNHGLDVVVFGEGEGTIADLLRAWQDDAWRSSLGRIPGIGFMDRKDMVRTAGRPVLVDLDGQPDPDFGLLKYARMRYYPVGRIRGCNMNCEFCAVKERTRCARPEKTMQQIISLVENSGARRFFEVSDHFGADRKGAVAFCRLLANYQRRTGRRITMTVQTRINDARDAELLLAMKDAGINNIAIGYESPIDEELKAMRKGYLSRDMVRWSRIFHRFGFFIHGMFIFGYPRKGPARPPIPLEERVRRFRAFIKKAKIDTVQVLLTVPLPGTDLYRRLQEEGRIYPLTQIGWQYYDGQFPLFEPDDGISPEELQRAVTRIVSRFYRFRSFLKMLWSTAVHFPRIVFVASFTIFSGSARHLLRAYRYWKNRYFRNPFLRFGGYLLLKGWLKKFKNDRFLEYLKRARELVPGTRNRSPK